MNKTGIIYGERASGFSACRQSHPDARFLFPDVRQPFSGLYFTSRTTL